MTQKNRQGSVAMDIEDSGAANLKCELYEKMERGDASARELMHLSLLRGLITQQQYTSFLQIDVECEENDEDEEDSDSSFPGCI